MDLGIIWHHLLFAFWGMDGHNEVPIFSSYSFYFILINADIYLAADSLSPLIAASLILS